jgi:hypothetical protein
MSSGLWSLPCLYGNTRITCPGPRGEKLLYFDHYSSKISTEFGNIIVSDADGIFYDNV